MRSPEPIIQEKRPSSPLSSKQLPGYTALAEPYRLLEEEGVAFSDPPTLEDFEEQFAYSIELIQQSGPNTLFDRSPFDFLAYAQVLSRNSLPVQDRLEEMEESLFLLDLIVFLPIEERDRIRVPKSEDLSFRRKVDKTLHDLLLDSPVEILEATGTLENRTHMVLEKKKFQLNRLLISLLHIINPKLA